jgi:hypothetical protein
MWGQIARSASTADWGTVPDWLSGLGTVIALLVLAREVRARRVEAGAAERRQASRVTASIEVASLPPMLSMQGAVTIPTGFEAVIHNSSDEPIFDFSMMGWSKLGGRNRPTKGEEGGGQLGWVVGPLASVPPGTTRIPVHRDWLRHRDQLELLLFFIDNGGRRWTRGAGGAFWLRPGWTVADGAMSRAIRRRNGARWQRWKRRLRRGGAGSTPPGAPSTTATSTTSTASTADAPPPTE